MLIRDVSKVVGISKKSIRFYEAKGFLKISRVSNNYRIYSQEDIEILQKIKLLRIAGISISDIKLLFDDVITIDELVSKRRNEIEKEFGYASEQLLQCEEVMQKYKKDNFETDVAFEEEESPSNSKIYANESFSVGIDIGTTTISAAAINLDTKEIAEYYTIPNNSWVDTDISAFSEQDPEAIYRKVKKLLDHISKNFPAMKSIGITGQMHGILYIDNNGNAVSNFITWQDKRGDLKSASGMTYCEKFREETGETVYPGYGFATVYYDAENGKIPKDAATFCNITDYVAMKLAGSQKPLVHSSIAASFGAFDLEKNEFKFTSPLHSPEVTDDFKVVGTYHDIPVSVGLGDNQASFLGAVSNHKDSILVNIGTGSQISTVTELTATENFPLEIRPLVKGKYILCGASLSGGTSYALLEKFFRSYVSAVNGSADVQYDIINGLAEKAIVEGIEPLHVKTCFYGTRENPDSQGEIHGITAANFSPEALALGVIQGICQELYAFFKDRISNKKVIVASGNAVQKNKVMQRVLSQTFGLPIKRLHSREEASCGAALFGAVAAGILRDESEFGSFIHYTDGEV